MASLSAIWLWKGSSVVGSRPVLFSSVRPVLISSISLFEFEGDLVPPVFEPVEDLVHLFRKFLVVDGVFVDAGADVVTYGVFHLRSFGPVRAHLFDVIVEGGIGNPV